MSRVAQAGPYNLIVRGALVSAPRVSGRVGVSELRAGRGAARQAAARAGHRAGAAAGGSRAAEARHPGGGGEVNCAV